MTHTSLLKWGFAASLLFPLQAAQTPSSQPTPARKNAAMLEGLMDLLDQSQKTGKGVLLYVGSHALGGVVLKVGETTVEMKNREYGRILVRLDRIDAAAGN